MKFLDSNIIAYAFYENKFKDNCRNTIREGGITDTLTFIEAFNIIELQTTREIATKAIKSLLRSNIAIVEIDINTVFEALKRAEKYKQLKFLGLIHYTVAILNECNEIVSYDKDFNGLDIKRVDS